MLLLVVLLLLTLQMTVIFITIIHVSWVSFCFSFFILINTRTIGGRINVFGLHLLHWCLYIGVFLFCLMYDARTMLKTTTTTKRYSLNQTFLPSAGINYRHCRSAKTERIKWTCNIWESQCKCETKRFALTFDQLYNLYVVWVSHQGPINLEVKDNGRNILPS